MAEVARGMRGATLEKGCAAHFHLHRFWCGCRLFFLSWHTWAGGRACPAALSAPAAPSCPVPSPLLAHCSCSTLKGLERALPSLYLQRHHTLTPTWVRSLPVEYGLEHKVTGYSLKETGGESDKGNMGYGPRGRPLCSWAPFLVLVSSDYENARHVPGWGTTGSFVSPPPQGRRHYSTLCPPNPPEDTVGQLWPEATIHTPEVACQGTLQYNLKTPIQVQRGQNLPQGLGQEPKSGQE